MCQGSSTSHKVICTPDMMVNDRPCHCQYTGAHQTKVGLSNIQGCQKDLVNVDGLWVIGLLNLYAAH